MQNGRTMPNGEAMSNTDPLLAAVRAYNTERDLFNADDNRSDEVLDALRDDLSWNTPTCTSDEGAFEALALVARDRMENQPNELTEGLLAAVLDYAHRRQLNA